MSNAFEKTHWFTQMIIYSHFLTWLPLMIWELGHEWWVITCTFIMPLCSYTHCLYLLSYLLCQVDALRSQNTHLWPFLLQDFIMFIWTPSVLLIDWQKKNKNKTQHKLCLCSLYPQLTASTQQFIIFWEKEGDPGLTILVY